MDTVESATVKMVGDTQQYQQSMKAAANANAEFMRSAEGAKQATDRVQQTTTSAANTFTQLESRANRTIAIQQRYQNLVEQATRVAQEEGVAQERLSAHIATLTAKRDADIAAIQRRQQAALAATAAEEQAAQRAVQAAQQAAEAQRQAALAAQQAAQVTRDRGFDEYERHLVSLRERFVPLAAAQNEYRAELTRLNEALRIGAVNEAEHAAALARTKAAFAQQVVDIRAQTGAINGLSGAFTRNRFAVQNAAFQVGDFFVQVASGQGVLRPLIQQGSQFLGVFGPWGAILGAAAAVAGTLAVALFDLGDAAETAEEKIKRFEDAVDAANRVLKTQSELEAIRKQKDLKEAIDLTTQSIKDQEAALRAQQSAANRASGLGPRGIGNVPGLDPSGRLSEVRAQLEETRARLQQLQQNLADLNNPAKLFPEDPKTKRGKTDAEREAELFPEDPKTKRGKTDAEREAERLQREAGQRVERFGRELEAVQNRIDPVAAATLEYARAQDTLNEAYDRGLLFTEEYYASLDKLASTYKDRLDPTAAAVRRLTDQQALQRSQLEAEGVTIGMTADQRAVYLAGIEAENRLKQQNIPLTEKGAQGYVEEARALEQLKIEQGRIKQGIEANDNAAQQFVGTFTSGLGEATSSVAKFGFSLEQLGSIGERVLNALIDQFIQLAYVNPLNNAAGIGGGGAPTLATFGSALLGLFGGTPAAVGSAAAGTVAAGAVQSGGGIMAFAGGGEFEVGGAGGTDSQLVQFYATPGERVRVETPQQVSNDNRRKSTATYHFHFPPNPNGFGYSEPQQIRRAAERIMRQARDA